MHMGDMHKGIMFWRRSRWHQTRPKPKLKLFISLLIDPAQPSSQSHLGNRKQQRARSLSPPSYTMSQDAAEQNIQMWKVKKLIKSLDSARGSVIYISCCPSDGKTLISNSPTLCRAGTSMISLIIPPKVCSDLSIIFVPDPDFLSRTKSLVLQRC